MWKVGFVFARCACGAKPEKILALSVGLVPFQPAAETLGLHDFIADL